MVSSDFRVNRVSICSCAQKSGVFSSDMNTISGFDFYTCSEIGRLVYALSKGTATHEV